MILNREERKKLQKKKRKKSRERDMIEINKIRIVRRRFEKKDLVAKCVSKVSLLFILDLIARPYPKPCSYSGENKLHLTLIFSLFF